MSKSNIAKPVSKNAQPMLKKAESAAKKRRIEGGDNIDIPPDQIIGTEKVRRPSSVRPKIKAKDTSQNKNPTFWTCGVAGSVSDSGSGTDYVLVESFSSKAYECIDNNLFWGPYLAERQWATVREDYSEDDNCWGHVCHDDAVRHLYVSGEDGLLGVSDHSQLLCAAPALWNGKDAILKERLFGLNGHEGNHGEDVKELYYYLDNMPDHSYMRALYKYPQCEFPYKELIDANRERSVHDAEFEIIDTGVFEKGYWDVMLEYVKMDKNSLACCIKVTNNGPQVATLKVIPQFYFRHVQKNEPLLNLSIKSEQPQLTANTDKSVKIKYELGNFRLTFPRDSNSIKEPTLLFTDNKSNSVHRVEDHQFTKDAFHRFIVSGDVFAVNMAMTGTKCGALFSLTLRPGHSDSVYWKLEPSSSSGDMKFQDLLNHFAKKKKETETYYTSMMPKWPLEDRNICIQAMAGLMWSKQYYLFDVNNWMQDFKLCKENTGKRSRNCAWSNVHNHHILLMPDKWEFPWYAGWDLAISAVLYARFDPKFAKQQIYTFLSEKYMHPNGQLPGCEFELSDPNPPLQAWAVIRIYFREGANDLVFLRKCYNRLIINYTWWRGQEHASTNLFGAGFLGMDNISCVNRSEPLPCGWSLVQADYTGWMACYALWMLQIVVELSQTDLTYRDLIPKFLYDFHSISSTINKPITEAGLWDPDDRFLYDAFLSPYGKIPIRLRSMVGLVPLLACATITVSKHSTALAMFQPYLDKFPYMFTRISNNEIFVSALPLPKVHMMLEKVFSEDEFLAPYGLRSMSKVYEKNPFHMRVADKDVTVKYTPGESDTKDFGGNSNWRGPVWVFMNYLLLECLDKYNRCAMTLIQPSELGAGVFGLLGMLGLRDKKKPGDVFTPYIRDLAKRLIKIFRPNKAGVRPVHGPVPFYSVDPKFKHLVLFYEYINADTGQGCGASHQTGWTASIIEILYRLHSESPSSK